MLCILYFVLLLLCVGQFCVWWCVFVLFIVLVWYLVQVVCVYDVLLLVIVCDNYGVNQFEVDLQILFGGDLGLLVVVFLDWEILFYDCFSLYLDIILQCLVVLYCLLMLKCGLVIVLVQMLLQQLVLCSYVIGGSFDLKVGQCLDLEVEKCCLESVGYCNVLQVMDLGDFVVCGGLFDVFLMGVDELLWVELLDEDIDLICVFDLESQCLLDKVEVVYMLLGCEVFMDEVSIVCVLVMLCECFDVDIWCSVLYQDLKFGLVLVGVEYYLLLFFECIVILFDYLFDGSLLVVCVGVGEVVEVFWVQIGECYEQCCYDVEWLLLLLLVLYLLLELLCECLNDVLCIEVWVVDYVCIVDVYVLGDQLLLLLLVVVCDVLVGEVLKFFFGYYLGWVLIVVDLFGCCEVLLEVLQVVELKLLVVVDLFSFFVDDVCFVIVVVLLEDGFVLDDLCIVVLIECQLFFECVGSICCMCCVGCELEVIICDFGELIEGVLIVYEDYGVGCYCGLIVMDVGGMFGEFFDIEYVKGDCLYVLVVQLYLISCYFGVLVEIVLLYLFGGEQWSKVKCKVVEKVCDVVVELLEIQVCCQVCVGLVLQVDCVMYELFVVGFLFEEIFDQLVVIDVILCDLVSSQLMDCVVCGDVGFGKIEVVVCVVFVVVSVGKQVVVLVLIMLLVEQYYCNFCDCFVDYLLKVEVLLCFKISKEIKVELEKVVVGIIDVIVGIYCLLQLDVKFKDLGMVIVDEEQ